MALVAYSRLPAFETMRREGVPVITPDGSIRSGLPHLSIGLLNLMPDAALRATDRQFIRLVSAHADRADLWVYPFTVAARHRGGAARQHIDDHYVGVDDLRRSGVDALIVTGANPVHDDLTREVFWEEMSEVFDWAQEGVHGVLCSCLATHAVLKQFRAMERTRLRQKRWGVYSHRLLVDDHPLVNGVQSPVDAPHSHWYDVTRVEMESVGLCVLMESDKAGVHMAASDDDFYVFFQGHPEYELVSLLKEYKREVGRFYRSERPDYPPYPEHYFGDDAITELEDYRQKIVAARSNGREPPVFPEESVIPNRASTWTRPGQAIYRNWLTQIQRRKG